MNKPIVQLLYNGGIKDVTNRKSALGSYIYTLSALLNNAYEVYINHHIFTEHGKLPVAKDIKSGVVKPHQPVRVSPLKSYFPISLKLVLKDFHSILKSLRICAKSYSTKANVYIEFYSYLSLTGYILSKIRKKPLILIYDGPVEEEYVFFNGAKPPLRIFVHLFQNLTLQRAQNVIVYSESVAKYLTNRFGINRRKILIHQNVDFSRFDIIKRDYSKIRKEGTINLGFIGSFLKWHRVDLLLYAFFSLREEGYNVKLYLIGHGMEYESIKGKVEESEFRDDVILTGFLDGEELRHYKQMIHIGIMPSSNWYGAPAKIFEYGAAGMGVIAPSTPTIADLFPDFENEGVLLFKNNDLNELLSSIRKCLDNRELLIKISSNLHEKIIRDYNKGNTFNFYSSLIKALYK
ncbi:glycosyltransferase family 4 protein [Pontibacter sp. H249]|uniref:glycosyltransferase family 4 protein n=1 Tax=Pontibacter sp. H249 TaxID=3133420 RepID=UPI0030C1BD7E